MDTFQPLYNTNRKLYDHYAHQALDLFPGNVHTPVELLIFPTDIEAQTFHPLKLRKPEIKPEIINHL